MHGLHRSVSWLFYIKLRLERFLVHMRWVRFIPRFLLPFQIVDVSYLSFLLQVFLSFKLHFLGGEWVHRVSIPDYKEVLPMHDLASLLQEAMHVGGP